MKKILFDLYSIDENAELINVKTNYKMNPSYNEINSRYKVNLSVNGKKTSFYLHKLIAQSFIEIYNEETDEIHFIDGNPKNCVLKNISIYRMCKIFP